MHSLIMDSLGRASCILKFPASVRPLLAARSYATNTGLGTTTSSSQPRRKAVTAFNDDGRVAWGNLTAREKVARTTQQSFNFSFILIGAVLTVWRFRVLPWWLLISNREAWHMLCIPMYSPSTVKPRTSTEPSIKWGRMKDASICWGTARRS